MKNVEQFIERTDLVYSLRRGQLERRLGGKKTRFNKRGLILWLKLNAPGVGWWEFVQILRDKGRIDEN